MGSHCGGGGGGDEPSGSKTDNYLNTWITIQCLGSICTTDLICFII